MPPEGQDESLEVFISQVRKDVEKCLVKRSEYRAEDNLSTGERKALRELQELDGIVIKPADKGLQWL